MSHQDSQNYKMTHLEELWWGPDDDMDRCVRQACSLYQAGSVISHESVARDLGEFLISKILEDEDTPHRDALLSVVAEQVCIANYLSNGRKPIVLAISTLLRLALPYADRPKYRREWTPNDD